MAVDERGPDPHVELVVASVAAPISRTTISISRAARDVRRS